MRAVRFERFGEPAEVLSLEEVELPVAGPGHARVRMNLRPINPSDLLTIRGHYGSLPALPATPGREGVGVIAEATELAPGRRVVPLNHVGTWQEEIVVPDESLVAVPDAVPEEAAAQAFINPLTVWAMLDELGVESGEWLLQSAAASALGQLVVQMAHSRGVLSINLVRRAEQAEHLRALGADEVIVTDDSAGLVERIQAITGRDGVSHALDAVGGQLGGEMVNALAPGGTMLVHGSLAHPERLPISSGRFLTRSLTLRGFWLNEWLARTPLTSQRSALAEILDQMASGRLAAPAVEATYDLADVVEAAGHAERSRDGKIMLSG